jgi:hypothetical protein
MEHGMSDQAEQAREGSRKATGQFGTQHHTDPGVVPAGPVVEQSLTTLRDRWAPYFAERHPGTGENEFYVRNVVYLQGTVGVVIRDPKTDTWRIANHLAPVADQPTYPTREEAAAAEFLYARTPAVIRHGIAMLREWQDRHDARPTDGAEPTIHWTTPRIAEGEKLLADAGLPIDET